ncbi:uncharacterized protein LOC131215601 [Anopheles bellator]|uniref:uncharacterized protein LOC131215601 n=1 Tax=Anopheles bellator TaxID=139047 RepID=UPI0026477700|nr:uncharacterized protein LOC131215601 [Anopheles bellator]
MPLYKNLSQVSWTILGMVQDPVQQTEPFVIGTYTGEKCPQRMRDFLRPLVDEVNSLNGQNVTINAASVRIDGFNTDHRALCLIKEVQEGSQLACHKCEAIGWQAHGGMVYPIEKGAQRTDAGFRELRYFGHHKEELVGEGENQRMVAIQSALVGINYIDMVEDFRIGDEEHLLHTGIFVNLLENLMKGNGREILPIEQRKLEKLNRRLMRTTLPCECSPRHFVPISKDLAQYLLNRLYLGNLMKYVGITFFKDAMQPELFDMFIRVYWGMSLLSSSYFRAHWPVAEIFFSQFLSLYKEKFGQISYKFHCLTHLVEEVTRFGPLKRNSCRPFDNMLNSLRHVVDRRQSALDQVSSTLLLREAAFRKSGNAPNFPLSTK